MKIQDAVDYIEANFTCEMGAPWRWADLLMSKPYQWLEYEQDVPALRTGEDVEHRLVARLITNISRLKSNAGYGPDSKPKLYWRWQDKVRIIDETIQARIYLDGNPGRARGNPSKPTGSPAVGQVRLAA